MCVVRRRETGVESRDNNCAMIVSMRGSPPAPAHMHVCVRAGACVLARVHARVFARVYVSVELPTPCTSACIRTGGGWTLVVIGAPGATGAMGMAVLARPVVCPACTLIGAAVGRVGAVGGDIGADMGVAPDVAKQQLHAHCPSIQACDAPVHCPCDAHEGQLVGSASVRD